MMAVRYMDSYANILKQGPKGGWCETLIRACAIPYHASQLRNRCLQATIAQVEVRILTEINALAKTHKHRLSHQPRPKDKVYKP